MPQLEKIQEKIIQEKENSASENKEKKPCEQANGASTKKDDEFESFSQIISNKEKNEEFSKLHDNSKEIQKLMQLNEQQNFVNMIKRNDFIDFN